MSLPGRLLRVRGVRVFVHEAGARAPGRLPVVMVHGWMISHYGWRKVIPELVADGHAVIALDLPGFGESDRPPPRDYRYDVGSFSDTLLGVLDLLEVPSAHLCGASLGGAVSLITAARHPERVGRLALVDPLVYPPALPPESALIGLPAVGLMLFRAASTRSMIRYLMKRDIYRDHAVVTDEWVDYIWERVNRPGGAEAAHETLRLLRDPGVVTRSTRAVRAPTLLVWGEDDRLFPSVQARRLAAEIDGAEVRIIPACGHAPAEERPEALVEALRPFFATRAERRREAVPR